MEGIRWQKMGMVSELRSVNRNLFATDGLDWLEGVVREDCHAVSLAYVAAQIC